MIQRQTQQDGRDVWYRQYVTGLDYMTSDGSMSVRMSLKEGLSWAFRPIC
jgi:hypothetical protein